MRRWMRATLCWASSGELRCLGVGLVAETSSRGPATRVSGVRMWCAAPWNQAILARSILSLSSRCCCSASYARPSRATKSGGRALRVSSSRTPRRPGRAS
jgi:hypothetical protein